MTPRAAKLEDCSKLCEFIDVERTMTLALPISKTGELHAAVVLYWHKLKPLEFYAVTNIASQKCRLLSSVSSLTGAVVIGTEMGTPFTLQMHGEVAIVDKSAYNVEIEAYYTKRGGNSGLDDIRQDDEVLLKFIPTWARFTDYAQDREQIVLEGYGG